MGVSTRARDRVMARYVGTGEDLYQLGSRLGNGGQGTVHRCTKVSNGQSFAAKVVDTKNSRDCAVRDNLEQEIQNMRRLQHPHIMQVVADFWEEGDRVIVMDLAQGGDLLDKVENELRWSAATGKTFPGLGRSELASRHVVRQLLDGIGHMHERGVIHRDLKLENILVTRCSSAAGCVTTAADSMPTELLEVQIADFGLSKYTGDRQPNIAARCKSQVGSPDFVAPEVLGQDSYDERVDLWSLGVMLYAMLCGQLPFEIRRNANLAQWHAKAVAKGITVCKAWQSASEDARLFVSGLLVTDPELRFDMQECLEHGWLSPAQFQSAVAQLCGCTGDALDSLELLLQDGSREAAGGTGGTVQHELDLQPDELILGVSQEECGQYLGAAMTVFTSKGQVIALQGDWAEPRHLFLAPAGCEIVGLCFEGGELCGVMSEDVRPTGAGSVIRIGARTGTVVDKVELHMCDGSVLAYGGVGGDRWAPLKLEGGEYLVAVEQIACSTCPGYLGSSIAFYTSRGRVLAIEGRASPRSHRFAAPVGTQICGLAFENGGLIGASTCPTNGDLSAVTEQAVP